MTTTNSRQLRILVDGILESHGINDLQLSMALCKAVKSFIESSNPSKTRQFILNGIQKEYQPVTKYTPAEPVVEKSPRIKEMEEEIKRVVQISPTGPDWDKFLLWAYQQEKEHGQKIEKFLVWWIADEWRFVHPPSNPKGWYVLWPQAFPKEKKVQKEGGSGYYA